MSLPSELIERRGRRCIAAVLSAKDDLADPYISDENADELRRIILNEVNDFVQYAAATSTQPVVELGVLVREIHDAVT